MIKCAIIDYDKTAHQAFSSWLRKIPDLEILGIFDYFSDARSLIMSGKLDLVFCDIKTSEIDETSFLQTLKKNPLFIYITKDPEYAIRNFNLEVLAYIIKPVDEERLINAINKARILLGAEKDSFSNRKSLIFKDRHLNVIMPHDDIFFIKSDKDYIKIATVEKEYIIWRKLSDLEKALDSAKQFLRVQKSYIVNLDFAKAVGESHIKMKGSIEDIPIGGQYKAELYERLGINNHNA